MPDLLFGNSEQRWNYWRCTTCGRVVTFPKPPAGPWAPTCSYGHPSPQPTEEVTVARV